MAGKRGAPMGNKNAKGGGFGSTNRLSGKFNPGLSVGRPLYSGKAPGIAGALGGKTLTKDGEAFVKHAQKTSGHKVVIHTTGAYENWIKGQKKAKR